MSFVLVGLGLILGLGLLLVLLHGRASRTEEASTYEREERSAMPSELSTARLVLSEHLLRCEAPDYLVTKVDQVFLTATGVLVPLETKTRNRPVVYRSDEVQLGVTAVVLASASHAFDRHPVASHGYVRLVTPDGTTYRRVTLPTQSEILDLARRRRELVAGRGEPPRPASSPAACPKCASRARCPQPLR